MGALTKHCFERKICIDRIILDLSNLFAAVLLKDLFKRHRSCHSLLRAPECPSYPNFLSRNLRSAKSRVGLNLQPYPSHCVPTLCALTRGLPSVYVVLSSQFVSNVLDHDSSSFISMKKGLDNSSFVPLSGPRHELISVLQSPYHFYLVVAE